MKKFIMALVCLMTMVVFSSCGTKYVVTANYDVCYPDGVRNYDGVTVLRSSCEPYVSCYSYNGTNYVSAIKTDVEVNNYSTSHGMSSISVNAIKKAEHFSSSTAPMRLNSYSVEKAKNKKNRITANTKTKGDDIYMSDILSH